MRIDTKKIECFVTEFRNAVDRAKEDDRFRDDQWFRNFPRGCCGITTELLAKYLRENGIDADLKYVCGVCYDDSMDKPSHAWLEVGNKIVVDITGDQFKNYPMPLCFDNPIYVGEYNRFYNQFEIDYIEDFDNVVYLDDIYVRSHMSRAKLYQIICEYLR